MTPSARLAALGLELPPARPPVGAFVPARLSRGVLYLSGQGPVTATAVHRGKVGRDVTVEEAKGHAQVATLNLLAAARDRLGSIDRITGILKVLGMVNAMPDFHNHPAVIDGCSSLLLEVFGPEAGPHARSAVGMGSLPGGISVEIEMICEVAD